MGSGTSKVSCVSPPSKVCSAKSNRIPNAQWITPVSHTSITVPKGASEKLEIRHEAFGQELSLDNQFLQSSTVAELALTHDEVSDLLSGRSNPSGIRSPSGYGKFHFNPNKQRESAHTEQVHDDRASIRSPGSSNLNPEYTASEVSAQGIIFSADAEVNEPVVQSFDATQFSTTKEVNKKEKKRASYPPIIEAETYVSKSKDGKTHLVNKHLIRHPNCAHDISQGEIHVEVTHKTPINPEEYLRLRKKPALCTSKSASRNLGKGSRPMWLDDIGSGQHPYEEIKIPPVEQIYSIQQGPEYNKPGLRSNMRVRKRTPRILKPITSPCCQRSTKPPKPKKQKCKCVGLYGDATSDTVRSQPYHDQSPHASARQDYNRLEPHIQAQGVCLEPICCNLYRSQQNECVPPQYAWRNNWPARMDAASEKSMQPSELDYAHDIRITQPTELMAKLDEAKKALQHEEGNISEPQPKIYETPDHAGCEHFDSFSAGVPHSPRYTTEVSEPASNEPIEEWHGNMTTVKPSISTTSEIMSAEEMRIMKKPAKRGFFNRLGLSRNEPQHNLKTQIRHGFPPDPNVLSDRCHCADGGLAAYLQQWQDHMVLLNQSLYEQHLQANVHPTRAPAPTPSNPMYDPAVHSRKGLGSHKNISPVHQFTKQQINEGMIPRVIPKDANNAADQKLVSNSWPYDSNRHCDMGLTSRSVPITAEPNERKHSRSRHERVKGLTLHGHKLADVSDRAKSGELKSMKHWSKKRHPPPVFLPPLEQNTAVTVKVAKPKSRSGERTLVSSGNEKKCQVTPQKNIRPSLGDKGHTPSASKVDKDTPKISSQRRHASKSFDLLIVHNNQSSPAVKRSASKRHSSQSHELSRKSE